MGQLILALALAVALAVTAGCGGANSGGMLVGREPTVVVEAPGPSAVQYRTDASANPVVGDAPTEGVARGIRRGSEQGGAHLEGDGRLAILAAWAAEQLGEGGTPPPHEVMEFFAHQLGIVEPTPHLLILGQPDPETLEAGVADSVSQRLARQPYSHYGAAVIPRQGLTLAVVTLSGRWLEIEPMPRHLDTGATIRLAGHLVAGYTDAEVAVTHPDGSVERLAPASGAAFDYSIPTADVGEYRLELLAEGPGGHTVLANFPVYVGVDVPTSVSLSRSATPDGASPEQIAEALLGLVNDARQGVGASAVARDDGLDSVALAHSRDMVEHGFIGHTSPTTGTAADRVTHAGYRSGLVLENIGRGYSAAEIHRGLMESPGHRANILNPDVSHVGIGVVAEQEGDRNAFVATEVFIRMNRETDLSDATERLLGMINDARRRRGAHALELDPNLTNAAREGAQRYFSEPRASQQDVVDDASASLRRFAIAFSRVGGLMAVVDTIEEAGRLEPTFDPDVRYVGIGVAQGVRPDAPPNSIAVVIMLGWPR